MVDLSERLLDEIVTQIKLYLKDGMLKTDSGQYIEWDLSINVYDRLERSNVLVRDMELHGTISPITAND